MRFKIIFFIFLLTSCSTGTIKKDTADLYRATGFAFIYSKKDYEDRIIFGKLDAAEPFIDLGNGKYDSGEKFVDLYSNGKWDAQLWYVDKNSNNKWDDGEPFEDLNKDGRRSYGEPYTDKNNNKLYDPPEQINNYKFNYSAVLFSEPFTDDSNGNYDLGESFQDNNGDGIWTPAEAFIDLNGDGIWTPAEEFEDTNGDGVWTPTEEFEDLNGNKMWDAINPKSEKLEDEKEFKEPIVDVSDEPVEGMEIPVEEPENQMEIFFEPFTELNENNNWDPAENFTDDNQNGIWDAAEPFIDLGNGKYDSGEKFVDLYSNGKWDAQL